MTIVAAIHPNIAVTIEFGFYSLIMRAATEDCARSYFSKTCNIKKKEKLNSFVAMKCAAKTRRETHPDATGLSF